MDEFALSFCRDLKAILGDDWREAVESMLEDEKDIHVGNYRLIHEDAILDVLAEELESDPYVLGCFLSTFLSDVTGWPVELIKAAQKGEAFEALGEAIISSGFIRKLAEKTVAWDGYGHHFSHYDGSEEMVGEWYVFRTG